MIKTYKLNMRMNSSRIVLTGESGNKVVYNFEGGNVINNVPATITISGKYEQDLLEASEAFRMRAVLLTRVQKEEEDIKAEKKAEEEGNESVESVTSVTEAINYVAEKWGEVAKTAKQAKEIALAHGVEFPNLKTGKGK